MLFDLILILLMFILASWELWGIWLARRKGLTKNISRLLTHSLMLLLALTLIVQFLYWRTSIQKFIPGVKNIPYIILLVFTLILTFIEATGILKARIKHLTKNISRLITHFLMCIIAFILIIRSLLIG